MSMEVKRIREGGNNDAHIVVPGPTTYGQLTLKRGMTNCFDLWDWFRAVQTQPRLRASTTVALLSQTIAAGSNSRTALVQFLLSGCLPVKLKAPSLNAVGGMVAIEELQIAYASLQRKGA
jgi:phage tail-like protein